MTSQTLTDISNADLRRWFSDASVEAMEQSSFNTLSITCSDGCCHFVNAGLPTLAIEFMGYVVRLYPSESNFENPAKSEFHVIPGPNGFEFQPIPQGCVGDFPRLNERQFLIGVLNVAHLRGWGSN
jgi:hypothetical protein